MDERQKMLAKAVVFLVQTDGIGLMGHRISFLKEKGLTDDEIMQAIASAQDPDVAQAAVDLIKRAEKETKQ